GAPTLQLFERFPVEVQDLRIDGFEFAVWRKDRNHSGNAVDDLPRIAFAITQGLLAALLLVDVDVQSVPAHDTSVGVTERQPADLKPAILSVCGAKTVFRLVGLSCRC